jgi:hypothetical protein
MPEGFMVACGEIKISRQDGFYVACGDKKISRQDAETQSRKMRYLFWQWG